MSHRWHVMGASVHARLQVSVCSGYDLCHCSCQKMRVLFSYFDPRDL